MPVLSGQQEAFIASPGKGEEKKISLRQKCVSSYPLQDDVENLVS